MNTYLFSYFIFRSCNPRFITVIVFFSWIWNTKIYTTYIFTALLLFVHSFELRWKLMGKILIWKCARAIMALENRKPVFPWFLFLPLTPITTGLLFFLICSQVTWELILISLVGSLLDAATLIQYSILYYNGSNCTYWKRPATEAMLWQLLNCSR